MEKVKGKSQLELSIGKGSWQHGKTKAILISGTAGVGKTTLANYLKDYLLDVFDLVQIIPFAKSVKDVAHFMGWNGKKDKKGRKLLQLIGTECGRQCISKSIWTDKFIEKATGDILPPDVVIADDWRFPNEATDLKDIFDVTTIRVFSEKIGGLDRETSQHASETSLPVDPELYNIAVYNNGTKEELEEDAKYIAEEIINGNI